MTRGDVVLAELGPVIGSESNKQRPVIVVGNQASLNAVSRHGRGVVTVVPLTSNDRVRGPMHLLIEPSRLNGLIHTSKVQAEQVRSIDQSRIVRTVGRLRAEDLSALDRALRYHLDLR
jgi:mRNA interferase MazF